jgi:hypothetical protein
LHDFFSALAFMRALRSSSVMTQLFSMPMAKHRFMRQYWQLLRFDREMTHWPR